MCPYYNKSFLIPPLLQKYKKGQKERVLIIINKDSITSIHCLCQNKTEGKQSCCSGQFEQRQTQCRTVASARPQPVLMQLDGQRWLPIHTASPQISDFADKLFLFVFIYFTLLASVSASFPSGLPPPLLCVSQDSQWAGEEGSQRQREGVCLIYFTRLC